MLDPTAPSSDPTDADRLRRPAPPRSWRDRVEDLADATGTTPSRVAVGTALALVAVGVGWWLLRPPAAPPETSLPFATTTVPVAAATTAATAPTGLVVHVAGAVVRPGVHELPGGSRVADAIEVAGGLAPDADGGRINLAAPLVDGARVYVPAVGEEPPPIALGEEPPAAGGGPTGPVDLNTADAAALEALPGIGPATASAILEHRSKVGAFTSVDQLLDVPGIGDAKLEALRDLVGV